MNYIDRDLFDKNNYSLKLPGNITKNEYLRKKIRVNYSGESAAVKIYKYQAKFIKEFRNEFLEMKKKEEEHLNFFEDLILQRDLSKSKLNFCWEFLGSALGFATGIAGIKAGKICTEAVESTIVEHYNEQIQILKHDKNEVELHRMIEKIRDEELEHSNESESFDKSDLKFKDLLLSKIIRKGCKIAIKIAEKI